MLRQDPTDICANGPRCVAGSPGVTRSPGQSHGRHEPAAPRGASSSIPPCARVIGFSVDDIDAAHEFYGTTLGLEVEANPMGFLDIRLPRGGWILVYSKPNHEPASFTILNFPVADVDAVVDNLIARGVQTKIYSDAEFPSDERGIVCGGGQSPDIAWFRVPAGNVLAVMQA